MMQRLFSHTADTGTDDPSCDNNDNNDDDEEEPYSEEEPAAANVPPVTAGQGQEQVQQGKCFFVGSECFELYVPDYKTKLEYQWTRMLSMIFGVKQDGRHKARLVAGGHMVNPVGINSRHTVDKGISVRLLDLITHRDNLPIS
jgi:hypothetical protein